MVLCAGKKKKKKTLVVVILFIFIFMFYVNFVFEKIESFKKSNNKIVKKLWKKTTKT